MKCRKLISAVLALCMVLTSFGAVVSADEAVSYNTSPITFSYGEDAANALIGGKTLTAKVSVSKTGGEKSLTFAMFLYKNNKPVDVDMSTKSVSGETVDFDLSFTTPADVTGCSVVAFLWDSLKGMNAICNSAIFPEGSTKISALTVDGTALKGFNPDVYEYTYEVDSARDDVPVITAKTFDGSAVVKVQKPTDFPGKSVIKVTHPGGASAEYTVSYKVSGITSFVENLTTCYDDMLPKAFGGGAVTHKAQFVPNGLKVGEDGYLNRSYKIETVNDDRLNGKDRIVQSYSLTSTNNGGTASDVNTLQAAEVYPWINFTLLRGATIRVLLCSNTQKAKLINEGYKEEVSDNANGFFSVMVGTANKAHKYMYSKHFDEGTRVSIPNVGEGSNSVYTVVVDYDPFGYVPDEEEPDEPDVPVVPDVPEDESLHLKSLTVDGVAVAGFDAKTNEYTVNLTQAQASAKDYPVVAYELADKTSSVVVTNPTEYPGKATVTVTNAETDTNTYTVNYAISSELIAMKTNVEGKLLNYVQGGLTYGGAVAADRDPKTSWYIDEINMEDLKGNTTIFGGVNSTVDVSEFTFNLPRKAIVRVIYNTAANANIIAPVSEQLKNAGFTYENDTSYYKIVVSNRINETKRYYRMMHYKEIDAGELTLPYCMPEMPTLVAIEYLPWGKDSFGGEEPDVPGVDPEAGIKLESLKIDGVEVENFDSDITEYTVALTDAQLASAAAPRVTYKLMDENSAATVTKPESFPGKATVTVTDGTDSKTYTVTYTADEMIKDMYVLNESNTISKDYTGGDADTVLSDTNLPKYVRAGLVEYTSNQPIYTDRNGLRGIHDKTLIGNDVILTPVSWSQNAQIKAVFGGEDALDWLNFTVKRDAVVKVFTGGANPSNSNITDYGFSKYTNGVMDVNCCNTAKAYFCNKINGTVDRCQTIMYTKNFKAGSKVVIPNFTFADYSYSVAIEYPDWDANEEKFVEVELDGEVYDEFTPEKLSYDVELSYGASYPVISAKAQTTGIEVAVIQPSAANDGVGKITVTENEAETVYTFNVSFLDYVALQGEITKVEDGRDAIVSIVHDDGIYATATYLNKKLGELGLKGSVAAVAQNINDSNKAQWQAIWDDGVLNLESHSYTHTYMGQSDDAETALVNGSSFDVPQGKMTNEIVGSQEYLREMFPGQRVLNFIKPGVGTIYTADGSTRLPQISSVAMNLIKENYISARSTGNTAFTKQGVDTIPPTDYYATYCWMVQNTETGEEWITAVDEAIENNAWSSFLFHGISETAPTKNEAKTAEADVLLEAIAAYEKEGKVWVPHYSDAVMYTKEAITAKAEIKDYTSNPNEDNIIEVTVTDELDNDVYNYPLTVKTKVPASWSSVASVQGGREETLTPFTEGNDTFVYAHVIPDSGAATLSEAEIVPATLSDIKVDGVSVADFDSKTFSYEVEFDVASLTMPVVTYNVNGEGTAVVTDPTSFPGEATITVTEGSDENVYTIKYVPSDDYIADLKLCDEANVASTSHVFPKVVSGIKVGDKHFTDRAYAIETINEEGIENSDRIMTATGWRWDEQPYGTAFNGSLVSDWMSFTLNRGAYVTVYDDSTTDNTLFSGFETESSSTPYIYVKYNDTRGASYTVKHTRYFAAGSVVNIPNASAGETYAVVVTYAPWDFEEPEIEEIPEFKISYSDLVPKVTKGENANVSVGNWYGFVSETNMDRQISKEFALPEGQDTQTITLTMDKFTNQNVAIIVTPTEEDASNDVIVNADGSEIVWDTHNQASVDYNYDAAGDDGYNADYVTYAQYAKNVTPFSNGDAYVYRTMVSSDDKYISGSMVVYSRNLLCGGVAWIDIPEEYVGSNYIVPADGKMAGGTYTLEVTVNAPVKVVIYTNQSAATVTDDISADEWTVESASFKKRHMNVVDNLTVAYLIKKGYLPEADIGAYATANDTYGYRIRRYDLFPILKQECGVDNGWTIDPEKREATGFVGTLNDYTYEQYLEAWVEE